MDEVHQPISAMEEAYRAWKSDPATRTLFTEVEVNRLGYQLLGSRNLAAATKAFELNAESCPDSWNAWDSLALAHVNAGSDERAIELYEESLELSPGSQNARDMIAKVRDGG